MSLEQVLNLLKEVYDNQDIVSLKSIIAVLKSCNKITVKRKLVEATDIFGYYTYKVSFTVEDIGSCALWVYFYNKQDVLIQHIHDYNDRRHTKIDIGTNNYRTLNFRPLKLD